MIVFVEVFIGNAGDDGVRTEIFAYDSEDMNIVNNLQIMIEQFVTLDHQWGEFISTTRRVYPQNISSDIDFSRKINKQLKS